MNWSSGDDAQSQHVERAGGDVFSGGHRASPVVARQKLALFLSWINRSLPKSASAPPLAFRPVPCILNPMVQYSPARLDDSFAALSDATRRGVLQQLGRSDASI